MGKIGPMMQFQSLLKELRYALTAPADWRSSLSLLAVTARFHAYNALKRPHPPAPPVALTVAIGTDMRTISIRPATGDIFILYEVLAFDSYLIADAALDPASVKTVVDCGANIGLTGLFLAARYPKARVICVEPDPQNFALLKANISGEPRIVAVQAAIVGSPTLTRVTLTQSHASWGNRTR